MKCNRRKKLSKLVKAKRKAKTKFWQKIVKAETGSHKLPGDRKAFKDLKQKYSGSPT